MSAESSQSFYERWKTEIYGVPGLIVILGSITAGYFHTYQSVTQQLRAHHLALSLFQSWMASLPGWLVVTIPFAIVAAIIFVVVHVWARKRPTLLPPAVSVNDDEQTDPFRVAIKHLQLDTRSGDAQVVAEITVKNMGKRAAIQKWQMLLFYNGREVEAGRQNLQGAGYCLEEPREQHGIRKIWSFDDQIQMVTAKPFATGEEREGFFWALLPNTAGGISISDVRTVYMQYESDKETYKSNLAGACVYPGPINLT